MYIIQFILLKVCGYLFKGMVYNKYMNKPQNSQFRQYGKYSVFAVVFAVVFLSSSVVFADSASMGQSKERSSEISKVVQSLRSIAGRDSNIGQEISKIAKEQEASAKAVEEAMDEVDSVGGFRQLFLGTDYKNLGALKSELVKTQSAIERLTKAMERTTDVSVKADLQKQIDVLKATLAKAEQFAKDHEGKFSLLGWFVKLFN